LSSRPPHDAHPVFFLDRCLGRNVIADALLAQGFRIERHDDHFPQDQSDDEWLPKVGAKGWIVLTRDKNFDKNRLELRALYNSGTASFVLTGAQMTGQQMAATFLSAMPTMLRFLKKFHRPFVARITRTGRVRIHLTSSGIIGKLP
jgi:hypothetical protein